MFCKIDATEKDALHRNLLTLPGFTHLTYYIRILRFVWISNISRERHIMSYRRDPDHQ